MTSKDIESSSQPSATSIAPLAEDHQTQEDNSSKEVQTVHEEGKEVADEDRADVTDFGTEDVVSNDAKQEAAAGSSDSAEAESQPSEGGDNNEEKEEAGAAVADRVESDTQPSEKEAKVDSGHNEEKAEAEAEASDKADADTQPSEREEKGAENKAEPEPEAGAERDSAHEVGKAPAEPEPDTHDVGTTEGADDEEDEKPKKLTVDDLKTAPMDFRFPTTNQAKHCFTRYVEYHKCAQAKGEDSPDCAKYARYYRSLCPGEWVDNWNEQRENGTFPGPL